MRALWSQRRQHGMQTGSIGEPRIGERLCVIESSPARVDQPLREAPDGGLVGNENVGALKAAPAIDPDRPGTVDEDVGNPGLAQEAIQRAGADDFGGHRADRLEQLGGPGRG